MGIPTDNLNLLTGTHCTRFEHGEIETASAAQQEALDHVVAVESKRQFMTREARLRDHENGRTDFQASSRICSVVRFSPNMPQENVTSGSSFRQYS